MKRILILFFSFALIAFPVCALAKGTLIPSELATRDEGTLIPSELAARDEGTVLPPDDPENSNLPIQIEVLNEESENPELLASINPEITGEMNSCSDVDGDGVLTPADIDAFTAYLFAGAEPREGFNYDLDGDGFPTPLDLGFLIDYFYAHGGIPSCAVVDANQPPVIIGPNSATTTLGNTFEFYVSVTDADGDSLVFANELPEGALYSTSSGLFSWQPNATGTFSAQFFVSDGQATSSLTTSLEVLGPEITGEMNSCSDVDGDGVLTPADIDAFTAYLFAGAEPREGFNYDLDGDGFPTPLDLGFLIDYFYAHGGIPSCAVETNHAPEFTNFDPSTSTFSGDNYIYDVEATDPDGDSLVFSLLVSPEGMSIASSTGEISWTPTESQATSTPYDVTVSVSDGAASSTQSYSILVSLKTTPPGGDGDDGDGDNGGGGGGGGSVNVPAGPSGGGALLSGGVPSGGTSPNLPPYFANFNPPTVVTAGWAYIYDAEAVDPEGQTISFELLSGPAGMSAIGLTGLIVWVPDVSQASNAAYQAVIEVSDGVNVASANFQVIVNAPPVVAAPEIVAPVQDFGSGEEEIFPPTETEPIGEPEPSETPSPVANGEEEEEGFASALFAGILDFFSRLGDWILSHPFWSLLILLILFFFWLLIFRRRKNEEVDRKDEAIETGAVFQSSSEAAPEIITMPAPPIESSESNYS